MRRGVGFAVFAVGAALAGAGAYSLLFLAPGPGALAGLAFGLVLALAGAGLAWGRRDASPPRRGAWDGTPVPVPPDEIEQKEGEWSACLRCGSTAVRPLTLREGLVPGGGETMSTICGRCGFRGAPLLFDSATSYRAFVMGLHADRESATGERTP